MSATTVPAFLDALAAVLSARAGLSGVNVYTCPVAPENLGKEAIELGEEVSVEKEPASMSSRDLTETYTVSGSILVYSPIASTINVAAKACRDRALAILEEVSDELADDQTVDGTVLSAGISSQTWRQGLAPEGQLGRLCQVEFGMTVEAHVTP